MKKVISNTMYALKKIYDISPGLIFLTFFRSILESIVSIIDLLFVTFLLSSVIDKRDLVALLVVSLMMYLFNLVYSLFMTFANEYLMPKYMEILKSSIKKDIFIKIDYIDYSKYEDKQFYDELTISIQQSDTRMIQVLNSVSMFIGNVFSVFALSSILIWIDGFIVFLVVLDVASTIFFNLKISKTKYKQFNESIEFERKRTYVQYIYNDIRHIKNIKLFSKFNGLLQKKYEVATKTLIEILQKYFRRIWKNSCGQQCITGTLNFLSSIYLVMLVFNGKMIISNFITATNSMKQLKSNLINISLIIPSLYEQSQYIEKIRCFFNQESSIETSNQFAIDHIDHLDFDNIKFKYPTSQRYVINDLSLKIRKGNKIAFVGRNGMGKSTILKLICRLYKPNEGEFFFDDIPAANIDVWSLRNKISIVFQEVDYYATTLIENVLMREIENKEEDEKIVLNALKKVGLFEKVSKLPNGIYTELSREFNELGTYFSGGEYQKLMIARAYVKGGDILIFDEPSSSLDAVAERNIFEDAMRNFDDRAIIFVTHKLSNIKDVDKIYFIENGMITEQGTHVELMKNKGKYAELFHLQAEAYISS